MPRIGGERGFEVRDHQAVPQNRPETEVDKAPTMGRAPNDVGMPPQDKPPLLTVDQRAPLHEAFGKLASDVKQDTTLSSRDLGKLHKNATEAYEGQDKGFGRALFNKIKSWLSPSYREHRSSVTNAYNSLTSAVLEKQQHIKTVQDAAEQRDLEASYQRMIDTGSPDEVPVYSPEDEALLAELDQIPDNEEAPGELNKENIPPENEAVNSMTEAQLRDFEQSFPEVPQHEPESVQKGPTAAEMAEAEKLAREIPDPPKTKPETSGTVKDENRKLSSVEKFASKLDKLNDMSNKRARDPIKNIMYKTRAMQEANRVFNEISREVVKLNSSVMQRKIRERPRSEQGKIRENLKKKVLELKRQQAGSRVLFDKLAMQVKNLSK